MVSELNKKCRITGRMEGRNGCIFASMCQIYIGWTLISRGQYYSLLWNNISKVCSTFWQLWGKGYFEILPYQKSSMRMWTPCRWKGRFTLRMFELLVLRNLVRLNIDRIVKDCQRFVCGEECKIINPRVLIFNAVMVYKRQLTSTQSKYGSNNWVSWGSHLTHLNINHASRS